QDALDDVLVRGVALGLALEDPHAGLGAEDGAPPLVTEDPRLVALGRAGREDDLAQVAEADRREPVGVPLDAGPGGAPALADALPHRIDLLPGARVLAAQPGPLLGAG